MSSQRINHIGVLTSGGDAPGMNPAIRAVTRTAIFNGLKVTGIHHGYAGLISGEMKELTLRSVGKIISLGGTMLKSSRSEEFLTPEGRKKAYDNLKAAGIDALVVIGGDGSMRGAMALEDEFGVKIIGIPGTIDNDLYGTDYTIGFDSAVQVATECIDKIRDTATSHDRLFLVEVMGRDSGHIALRTALASGAVAVLMPEDPISIEALHRRLVELKANRKSSNIIIVAEGNPLGNAHEIAELLKEKTATYDTRVSVLGHLQRGGSPTSSDRVRASELGSYAVSILSKGQSRVMVGISAGDLGLTPLEKAVNQKSGFDEEMYSIVNILSQ